MPLETLKLMIATNNPGKFRELKELLSGVSLKLAALADFPDLTEVEETGSTFDENARLKARGYAMQTGLHTLADDSGLEVEALDNRPGVLSARYGGANMSFAEKMAKLLVELDKIGNTERRARFVCSMAVADENGNILVISKGICEGKIATEPRGKGGFGYDPLFIPDGFNLTFGELPEAIKQKISHRARAFEQIIPFLRDFSVI